MSDILTTKEIKELKELGKLITSNLGCNVNNFSCRTCRLATVQFMKKYLEIHNFKVTKK